MPLPPPDPFAAALAVLFRAPGSAAATYTPPGGQPVALRVIRTNGREVLSDTIFETEAAQIQRVDVDQPVKGASLLIDGERFTIQSPPELDRERLTWTCALQPA